MAHPGEMELFGNSGDYDEIVGEQTRGGQDSMVGAVEILGEMLKAQGNPAYNQLLARRAAAARPALQSRPVVKARDWFISFSVFGTAGTTQTVQQAPQCLFRAEKLIANDSTTTGTGTLITGMFIGQQNQLPAQGTGTPTLVFANNALGNGIKFDTCKPAISIQFNINFISTGTWQGTLLGKAVL